MRHCEEWWGLGPQSSSVPAPLWLSPQELSELKRFSPGCPHGLLWSSAELRRQLKKQSPWDVCSPLLSMRPGSLSCFFGGGLASPRVLLQFPGQTRFYMSHSPSCFLYLLMPHISWSCSHPGSAALPCACTHWLSDASWGAALLGCLKRALSLSKKQQYSSNLFKSEMHCIYFHCWSVCVQIAMQFCSQALTL